MAKFVQLLTFYSAGGKFDEVKDTHRLNEVLKALQDDKATIISVLPAAGGAGTGTAAVYVITYEAPAPVEINK